MIDFSFEKRKKLSIQPNRCGLSMHNFFYINADTHELGFQLLSTKSKV
jgi:hypothetical protein